ncbi:MAG: acyltransferase family protein [Candidatus Hodarchaeales archaeon]|jgi:hypothetical protein
MSLTKNETQFIRKLPVAVKDETYYSTKPKSLPMGNRIAYVDNLRIYLTILVILHHVAVVYGGAGGWPVIEGASDEFSPILLTLFNAINQAFFMSAFFLLAGYFSPRAYDKKGPVNFMKDRVIRLGIPLAIYTTIIITINHYLVVNYWYHEKMSIWDAVAYRIRNFEVIAGHLWFVQALLIFASIYVLFRVLTDRLSMNKGIRLFRDKYPSNNSLLLCIGILALLTFAVRIFIPVGEEVFNLQLGHFVHYTFCFYAGILAYRGKWLERLSEAQARRWGIVSLAVMPFILVIALVHVLLGGALEGSDAYVRGGLYWQAFAYAVWETILMIGIITWLLYIFREKLNHSGPTTKKMAGNAYTVYIVHQTIVTALAIVIVSVAIPTTLKFAIVSVIAIPLCFAISHLIRKAPYTNRVLG